MLLSRVVVPEGSLHNTGSDGSRGQAAQEGSKSIAFSLPSTDTLNRTQPALGLSGLESTGARSKLKSVAAKTLELSL